MTEAGYVSELMERLALSPPDISFQFITNGQTKLHTSGNHNLKDVIYHIYGRDVAANLAQVEAEQGPVRISGFVGKPVVSGETEAMKIISSTAAISAATSSRRASRRATGPF